MLDNMIERGKCKPVMVVCVSYFEGPEKGEDVIGYDAAIARQEVFYQELINDVIPAVEGHYSTYAKTTDKDGIIASRDHRAMGGYSAGGGVTWYAFDHILEYCKWYLDFSGTYKASENGKNATPEEIAGHLEDTIGAFLAKGYKKNDFYIYMTVGNETDKNHEKIVSTFEAMMEANQTSQTYSYGKDPAQNNLYFCISDHDHSAAAEVPHLYNALLVAFQ